MSYNKNVKRGYNVWDEDDIAIIGMSCKLPLADNLNEYWDLLQSGTDCVREFADRSCHTDTYNQAMGYPKASYIEYAYLNRIDEFDYSFFNISKKEADMIDPGQRLMLQTAWAAFEDSGYGQGRISQNHTGVFIAYKSSGAYNRLLEISEVVSPAMAHIGTCDEMIAGRLSYLFDLKGPSMVINTACSSSLVAVHEACMHLLNGECDIALAGSAQLTLMPTTKNQILGIESETYKTRAFDINNTGTGLGEGICAVVLKPYKKALEDGDNIYALIKGSAVNNDGKSMDLTAPNPRMQEDVIVRSWEAARIDPRSLVYIEAHGTATKLGDPIEISSLNRAFKRYTNAKQFCGVGSVKTNMGHLVYSAGLAGLIKVVLALINKKIPPSIHFDAPGNNINFIDSAMYLNDRLSEMQVYGGARRCGVSSFGLSGTNCHMVLEEMQWPVKAGQSPVPISDAYILTVSAKSEDALDEYLEQYRRWDWGGNGRDIRNICYSSSALRTHYQYRFALIIRQGDSISEALPALGRGEGKADMFYGYHRIVGDGIQINAPNVIDAHTKKGYSDKAAFLLDRMKPEDMGDVQLLEKLCQLYIAGADINWQLLYKIPVHTISLPTYPFQRTRCWPSIIRPKINQENPLRQAYYEYGLSKLPANNEVKNISSKKIALISIDESTIHYFEKSLIDSGHAVQRFWIGENATEGYDHLFSQMDWLGCDLILYVKPYRDPTSMQRIDEIKNELHMTLYGFLRVYRSLLNIHAEKSMNMVVITHKAYTDESRCLDLFGATLHQYAVSCNYDHTNIVLKCIDIESMTSIDDIAWGIFKSKQKLIIYRGGTPYTRVLKKADEQSIENSGISIVANNVYLISGGTGYIGIQMARYLSSKAPVTVVLVSRSGFPGREEWDGILSGTNKHMIEKIKAVKDIEHNGTVVDVVKADVGDESQVRMVFEYIRQTYINLNGIIHCAGTRINRSSNFSSEDMDMQAVYYPKILGCWLLDQESKEYDLDFFWSMSSNSVITSGRGIGDYIAANEFLEIYSRFRHSFGRRIMSINWPLWEKTAQTEEHENNLFHVMHEDDAFTIADRILDTNRANIIVGNVNEQSTLLGMNPGIIDFNSLNRETGGPQGLNEPMVFNQVKLVGRDNGSYTDTEHNIAKLWGYLLGLDEINLNDDFYDLGGNSILAIKLEAEFDKLGYDLKVSDLYLMPTINELAPFLDKDDLYRMIPKAQAETIPETNYMEMEKSATVEGNLLIKDVEPFNHIFFKHCIYNALFPILIKLRGSELPLLVNEIIVYNKDHDARLQVEYLSHKTVEAILEDSGITMIPKRTYGDVVNDIKTALGNGHLVIVHIDCFYESIRTDMFQKHHWAHALLVYGYDLSTDSFMIFEHKHRDSLNYERRLIPSDVMRACCLGYLEFFSHESEFCMYEFISYDADRDIYRNKKFAPSRMLFMNMQRQQDKIENSLAVLCEYIKWFRDEYDEIINKPALSVQFMSTLNSIIDSKSCERYRLSKLWPDNLRMIHFATMIEEIWRQLRNILVKEIYLKKMDSKKKSYVMDILDESVIMEDLYIKALYKEFSKNA